MTDRPYQMLPPLDEEQRHLLRQSIKANGVLEPVVFDEDGEILDGHHRVEIAEELDIDYPFRVVKDLDENGKRRYAITTNVARRQLSSTVRSGLVAQLRMQGLSIRKIAEETGLPKSTVSDDIRQLSDAGQLKQPERIKSRDGRSRPSTRPTPIPGPSDTTTKPPVGPGTTPVPAVRESPVLTAPQEPDPNPEPAGDPTAPSAGSGQGEPVAECLGTDMDCGRPMPCPDHPVDLTADIPDIDVLLTALERLLETVLAEVEAITAEVDLGEHAPIAVELAADLQIAVDLLASCRAGVPA